jgi:hypothetical protein
MSDCTATKKAYRSIVHPHNRSQHVSNVTIVHIVKAYILAMWQPASPHCKKLLRQYCGKCPHACGHKACLHDLFPSKRERQRHGDHGDHPGGGGGRHLPPLCHYGALLQVRGRPHCPPSPKNPQPISVLPFFNNYLSCNIIIFFSFHS